MRIITGADETRACIDAWKSDSQVVGLVPTMGCLHAGHLALIERARELVDKVVVSVFVNRLQFDRADDYETYPRNPEADLKLLEQHAVDLAFTPTADELFTDKAASNERIETLINKDEQIRFLTTELEGRSRPGHFGGVIAAVDALYKACAPDIAVFGNKDYQQLLVIRRFTEQLNGAIRIVAVPTVREGNHLACSSRNTLLDDAQRATATGLHKVLSELAQELRDDENMARPADLRALEQSGCERLTDAGLRPDYVAIRRTDDLVQPGEDDIRRPLPESRLIVLGAAYLGSVRLIDNIVA